MCVSCDAAYDCRLCGGPLVALGQAGRLLWVRCQNCGMQYSKTVEPCNEEDDDGDDSE